MKIKVKSEVKELLDEVVKNTDAKNHSEAIGWLISQVAKLPTQESRPSRDPAPESCL